MLSLPTGKRHFALSSHYFDTKDKGTIELLGPLTLFTSPKLLRGVQVPNPQPSTHSPQPTTLNPQPSNLNPQPSALHCTPLPSFTSIS